MGVGSLAAALSAAQGEIASAPKSSVNPHFRSKYSDLTEIWSACREALVRHKIAVIQAPQFDENGAWLETHLIHASGEAVTGRFPLKPTKPDMQGFGSAISYAKRYSLAAMVGVVSEEDNGNEASKPNPGQAAQNKPGPKAPQVISVPAPGSPKPSEAPGTRGGFDPKNDEHVKILMSLINAKNCNRSKDTMIEGAWAKAVFAEMKGKTMHQLDAVIEATDPNKPDKVDE